MAKKGEYCQGLLSLDLILVHRFDIAELSGQQHKIGLYEGEPFCYTLPYLKLLLLNRLAAPIVEECLGVLSL